MKQFLAIYFWLSFISTQFCFSQAPVVTWHKAYGSNNGDYSKAIRATSDGGYIVVGYTESDGGDVMGYHGNPFINDIWVIKLDIAGNIQWQRCLGGTYMDQGSDIRQTADGGMLCWPLRLQSTAT